jgi:ribose 5-phosphate isomerase A
VIGDITKQVTRLGSKTPLPIEVIPFAVTPVRAQLETLGASVQVRQLGNQVYLTDNSNIILDCSFPNGIADPKQVHTSIRSIVGVVETGLFLNMAEQVIIGGPAGVTYLGKPR